MPPDGVAATVGTTGTAALALQRRRWRIRGRVQGVGFRPFVFRLARRIGLTGFVLNDSRGLWIEGQGSPAALDAFATELRAGKPPNAEIQSLVATPVPSRVGDLPFRIVASDCDDSPRAQISPDLATCPECVADARNPLDRRRHGYGLVNCTNCGPRFSIARGIPYDRANTTMADFGMCGPCRVEYASPADRRFHAQPIACNVCGPRVTLVDARHASIAGNPVGRAADLLLRGGVVAVKGLGGFHLAAHAWDVGAIDRLRRVKHRLHKPLAMMVPSLEAARRLVVLSGRGVTVLTSSAAPIVLAPRLSDGCVPASIAAGTHRIGVMLPYTPIHHLLFDALGPERGPLVLTSANDTDEPLVFTDDDACSRLGGLCDATLTHERPIERPVDDSVLIDVGDDADPIPLRRSRGYAPAPIPLPAGCRRDGIAVGADVKNTAAVVRDGEAILSQHLGDLAGARGYAAFKRAVGDLVWLFGGRTTFVAHDLHPGYVGTSYAEEFAARLGVPTVAVQHHHAHAAAVLAEHGVQGPALAVVCDGTGFGEDGTVWGGELLAADLASFDRLGHLRPISLPGGDAAAREPWRSALSLLHAAYGDRFVDLPVAGSVAPDHDRARFVHHMLLSGTGCHRTTSAGRLFDGVASLLGLCQENHFESQAAMALESAAITGGGLPRREPQSLFELHDRNGRIELDLLPLVREIVARRGAKVPVGQLAALFHQQFCAAWEAAVLLASERTGLRTVALSGGTFCNEVVSARLAECLTRRGLLVLRHRLVPPNDGGLSLGQAAVASLRVARGLVPTPKGVK